MITFVILHYLALDNTLKCIDCIKSLKGSKNIVVVDNASPDGSGAELSRIFEGDRAVSVILNNENAGFARGNNLGIEYARRKFNSEFVVVLNNDIEIEQQDFCLRIKKIYNKKPFDVLGPDIISQHTGIHQSPKRLKGYDLDSVRKKAAYVRRSQNPILMFLSCQEKKCKPIWTWVQHRKAQKRGIDFTKPIEGVVLHGSCVVFSRRFLLKHFQPFYSATFMYFEMEILEWLCRHDGSVCRYEPSLKVKHLQNASTKIQYSTIKERSEFVCHCLEKSLAAAEELILSMSGDENAACSIPEYRLPEFKQLKPNTAITVSTAD